MTNILIDTQESLHINFTECRDYTIGNVHFFKFIEEVCTVVVKEVLENIRPSASPWPALAYEALNIN